METSFQLQSVSESVSMCFRFSRYDIHYFGFIGQQHPQEEEEDIAFFAQAPFVFLFLSLFHFIHLLLVAASDRCPYNVSKTRTVGTLFPLL